MNLLGVKIYDPGTAATASTSANLALTALDTTNLRLTVTVPAHGFLFFRMKCNVVTASATVIPGIQLGVLQSTNVVGRVVPMLAAPAAISGAGTVFNAATAEFCVGGLAAGSTAFDMSYGVELVAAAGSAIKWGGPNNNTTADAFGAAVFEIWDPQPIPTVVAGGAGGLMISGTNTGPWSVSGGVSFTNSGGNALTLTASGSNGVGLIIAANGSGAGIKSTGGATGNAITLIGGATSGDGINITTTSGHGINAVATGTAMDALHLTGAAASGANAAGHAVNLTGGASSTTGGGTAGVGLKSTGGAGSASGNGAGEAITVAGGGTTTVAGANAASFTGTGAFNGLIGTGGATGNGMKLVGGSSSGHGLAVTTTSGDGFNLAPTAGHGVNLIANGSGKVGLLATGGTNAAGISLAGAGTGAGLLSTGGATGNGGKFVGGASSGAGLRAEGTAGNANGFEGAGQGSQDGMQLTGGATGRGLHMIGGATSGAGFRAEGTAGNSNASENIGQGSAAGLSATGGATGHGIAAVGGATSGDGINSIATTSGIGLNVAGAGTTKPGILATGGATTSAGMSLIGGATSGDGFLIAATTLGHGIFTSSVGNSRHGINAIGAVSDIGSVGGHGINAVGGRASASASATAGAGINALGGAGAASVNGAGDGLVSTGGGTTTVSGGAGVTFTHTGSKFDLNATTTPLTLAKTTNITGFNDISVTNIWTDTTAGDFTVANSIGKSIMNGVALGTGLTINAYTGDTPQTGDGFAIVNNGTFGNAQLVRSTTPANTLDVSSTGEAGLDFANIKSYAAGAFAPTNIVDSGTAQSATGTTLVIRSAANFADSELVGATVVIRSATTGAGQRRLITSNVGSTDTVSVDAWTTTPTGTIVYDIFGTAPFSAGVPTAVNVTQWNSVGVTGMPMPTYTQPTGFLATTFAATVGTSTLTQTQVTGGAYALNSASFAFNAGLDFTTTQKASLGTAVGVAQTGDSYARIGAAGVGLTSVALADVTSDAVLADAIWNAATASYGTAGTYGLLIETDLDATISSRAPSATALSTANWTTARAGYQDNLNVGGPVASHADILALNQSASKHVLLQTVGQYERPESGTTTYTVEARTFDASTGAAVDADSTPTITPVGIISGNLSANLSAVGTPATGVYRATYTVLAAATEEQIRFDLSATIASTTFTLSCYTQVVDEVSATWTSTDATHLTAIFDKLPSRPYLTGSEDSAGLVDVATVDGNALVQTAGKLWVLDGSGNAVASHADITGLNNLSSANVSAAVWNAATASYGTAGSYGLLVETNLDVAVGSRLAAVDYVIPPTVGAIADAVWDEAISGHLTAGSTGATLSAAASAGDPWLTVLPAAYAAGSAGYIVGTNLNAPITAAKLAADGLDAISVADPGAPANQTTFPKRMIALWRRFFSKIVKDNSPSTIAQYADDGTTVNSTQTFVVTPTTEEVDAAT